MRFSVSHRLIAVLAGAAALVLLPGPCSQALAAQQSQPTGGPAKAKAATKTVRLAFRNANIDSVLELYANMHGLAIIKDPSLTAQANLAVAKPLTVEEASTIIEAYLESLGYSISVDNNVARVVPRQGQGGRGSRGGQTGAGSAAGAAAVPSLDAAGGGGGTRGGFGGASSGDVQTRVFAIKYADAQSLARVVNEVYGRGSTTQQNQQRGMFPGMGGPFGGPPQFQGPQGGPFAAQSFGANVQDATMLMQTAANQPGVVRASYDTYSNSLIVTGTTRQLEQIQEMLDQLDVQVNNSTISEVFRLKYADCQQMATVISGLLIANANGGTQSGALRNTTFEARVFASAVAGPTTATGGQVVTYPESNTLIVTTTPQMMALVRSTVNQLDVRPRMQPTTFVYPLRYAWAGDVADILTSMFGRRSGTGTSTSYTGSTSGTQQVRRRLDQMGGGSGGFGGGGSFGGIGGGRGMQGGSFTQPVE